MGRAFVVSVVGVTLAGLGAGYVAAKMVMLFIESVQGVMVR